MFEAFSNSLFLFSSNPSQQQHMQSWVVIAINLHLHENSFLLWAPKSCSNWSSSVYHYACQLWYWNCIGELQRNQNTIAQVCLFWLKGHKVLERASNTAKQCPPFFYNVSCPCNGDSVVLHTSKVFWVTYFPEGLVAISEELEIQPVPPELEGLRKNSWAAYGPLSLVWKLTVRNSGGCTRAVGCIDLGV